MAAVRARRSARFYSALRSCRARPRAGSIRRLRRCARQPGRFTAMLFSCLPGAASAGAARRTVVKRRRRRLVVDLHCHCKTPAVEPLAALYYAPELEPMDMFSNDRTREVNRQQGARIAPQLTSVEQRISDMDRMGV